MLEKLKQDKPLLAPSYVWDAYCAVENVKASQPKAELTALVSLVRHACGIDKTLAAFDSVINANYQKWILRQNAGNHKRFTPEQLDWLKKGKQVTILEDYGTFVYVQYDNKKGYVHEGYLKKTTAVTTPKTPNPTPSAPQGNLHIVKKGETLWKISTMYKTSVATLQSLNNLHSTTIKVGQKLTVTGTASTTPTTPTTLITKVPQGNELPTSFVIHRPI